MKLYELAGTDLVAVLTTPENQSQEDSYASVLLVRCNKSALLKHIEEMLKENVEEDSESYEDVANQIDVSQALRKYLKKKNVFSIEVSTLVDSGLDVFAIAENMPDIKRKG